MRTSKWSPFFFPDLTVWGWILARRSGFRNIQESNILWGHKMKCTFQRKVGGKLWSPMRTLGSAPCYLMWDQTAMVEVMAGDRKMDELPVTWFLCLKAEGQEYSWIFWEECNRTKSGKSSAGEAVGAEENGQSCGLRPGPMRVSPSPSAAQRRRGSVPQYWETQKPALDVSLQRATGTSRTSSSPTRTAARLSKPYFKKNIYLVGCGES